MILVIAEKPSVARSIAKVLGAAGRENGCLVGNGSIVSWCFGHLIELVSADAYDPKYKRWNTKDLPIVPENWKYAVPSDKAKQLKILSGLMADKRVDSLVCATDAGREGELIFRLVVQHCGCKKPVQRLWISSMEDSAIREGFQNLKSDSEYDRLYAAALCRARADWIVGINATRLFSVLYRTTLNVGRVQSPTLAMLVQREAEIAAFRKTPFYTAELNCGSFKAAGEKLDDRQAAEAIRMACDGKAASVKAVIRQEKSAQPPKLYDLTTLQRDANRLLGYTAQQTLDYLQSLYEKKLCTYPRTDSRFLTGDMEASVPALASVAASICGADVPEKLNAGQVCDSAKISDHHAVVPTSSAGKADLTALPAGEREILRLVSRQLLCAVGGPHQYAETAVKLGCGGHGFTAKGKTVLVPGWKACLQEQADKNGVPAKSKDFVGKGGATEQASFSPRGGNEQSGVCDDAPELKEGQNVPVSSVSVKEGRTSPPKHFTEDTLLSAMETAGAKEMLDDAERKGLGTPATRAAILEKLVSTGFVERKKAKKTVSLIPTQVGVSLVTVLPEQLQSPLLTAEWENRLKQVERGELEPGAFLDGISSMLRELVKTYTPVKGAEVLFPSGREVVGKCPRCGGSVTESKKGFFCENPGCRFGLWKDNRFFAAKKVTLTKKIVASFLKDGRARLTGCYSAKTGRTYDATAILEDNGEHVHFRLEFDKGAKQHG